MKSQNISFGNLVQVKLDVSVIQDVLSGTIKDLYSKIAQLEVSNQKISKNHEEITKQITKIYELIEHSSQRNGQAVKQLQEKFKNINMVAPSQGAISDVAQKTPKQVLDHIESRLQLNLSPRGLKDIDMNFSPPNTDRLVQTFRVKENSSAKDDKELLDQKVYSIYQKTVEKIQAEITQLRRDFRFQLEQFTAKSTKILQDKQCQQSQVYQSNATNTDDLNKQPSNRGESKVPLAICNEPAFRQYKEASRLQRPVAPSLKKVQEPAFEVEAAKSASNLNEDQLISPLQKIQIKQFLQDLKREVKAELIEVVRNAEDKFEQINRTNSIIADHLVEAKKSMQDLLNDKDSLKLQVAGMREKGSISERQLCLLIDASNDHKNKLKSLENSLNKLSQEIKEYKSVNDVIKEEDNQDDSANTKRDVFRDSNSSFRSSIQGNLNPIRNNSILKINNNKIESLQDTIKSMNSKISGLVDRLNKMQDQKKRLELQQFGSTLPKIDKQNKSNVSPIQVIRKELKKVNDDIMKTNQKLSSTKDRLNQLYQSHADVPNKIEDIYNKLREYNQLQEDRLIQLIKELINRALADPFDNNFTNRLKRQINVKFLEIKHEYNCILKQIQSKVQNRAEIKQLQKVAHKFQESVLEVKSIASKKCETQDFKKGIKYLQGKLKQVFQFAKSQTVALANQQKQYMGAKKQQLH